MLLDTATSDGLTIVEPMTSNYFSHKCQKVLANCNPSEKYDNKSDHVT